MEPYSDVLFDEVEKLRPDVFHVLLQSFDDGRTVDSQGLTVEVKNAVVIMTSSVCAQMLLDGIDAGGCVPLHVRVQVMAELHQHVCPELLNRIEDTVMFTPLQAEQRGTSFDLLLASLRERLAECRGTVEVSEAAKALLDEQGYDPFYGARPLKRLLQRELETRIGRKLVRGDVPDGSVLVIDVGDGELPVTRRGVGAVDG